MKILIKQTSLFAFLLSLTFAIQSCNSSQKRNELSDREAIAQINKKFEEAYKSKNGKAIQALYADNGSLIAPYGTYEGSNAVRASFERDFSTHESISKMELTIESIEAKSDTILIVRGRFHIIGTKIEPNLPFELEGPYTHKCIKENGEWKIFGYLIYGRY